MSDSLLILQAKEIARLNGVYNKLLRGAGVEFIGAHSNLFIHNTLLHCSLQFSLNPGSIFTGQA